MPLAKPPAPKKVPTIREVFGLHQVQGITVSNPDNTVGYPIASTELIGIEVEVENVTRVNYLHEAWQSKADGSLRNNGIEFITLPSRACDAPILLESLMKRTLNADCCFSPRTSVHVHLNFLDNTNDDLTSFLALYSVYERLFYKFVGRQRIKNIYCVPITETALLSLSARKNTVSIKDWQKYTALNLKPLEQFGTIEFRHMHGTPDVTKLCVWIDLITKLKAYCLEEGSLSIKEKIVAMDESFDFRGLLYEIFGGTADYLKFESVNDVTFTYPQAKMLYCKSNTLISTLYRELMEAANAGTSTFYKARGF